MNVIKFLISKAYSANLPHMRCKRRSMPGCWPSRPWSHCGGAPVGKLRHPTQRRSVFRAVRLPSSTADALGHLDLNGFRLRFLGFREMHVKHPVLNSAVTPPHPHPRAGRNCARSSRMRSIRLYFLTFSSFSNVRSPEIARTSFSTVRASLPPWPGASRVPNIVATRRSKSSRSFNGFQRVLKGVPPYQGVHGLTSLVTETDVHDPHGPRHA
jgi:hypothetical protein